MNHDEAPFFLAYVVHRATRDEVTDIKVLRQTLSEYIFTAKHCPFKSYTSSFLYISKLFDHNALKINISSTVLRHMMRHQSGLGDPCHYSPAAGLCRRGYALSSHTHRYRHTTWSHW